MIEQPAVIWEKYLVNVLDVTFVAFILYQLLLLIRGTRAVQILFGMGVVALVTVLAQLLGLPSLSWLLQKFWIAGVLVLAILFQPELRSALARLGAKTSRQFGVRSQFHMMNELIGAIREANRRQMGMLIVLEGDMGLRNFIETGTVLDAEISRELLLSLFQPPGALHDGAVIVQNSRLAGAGCILPLAQDASLSKLLGTRHRAAVGITEVSDAWAVCVSEETGTISVASNGKLKTHIDPDEVRQVISDLFKKSVSSDNQNAENELKEKV